MRERCAAHASCPLITSFSLIAQQSHAISSIRRACHALRRLRPCLPSPLARRSALRRPSLAHTRHERARARLLPASLCHTGGGSSSSSGGGCCCCSRRRCSGVVDGESRAGWPGSPRLKAAARGWQPPPPPPKASAWMRSPRCGARVHARSESVSARPTLRHTAAAAAAAAWCGATDVDPAGETPKRGAGGADRSRGRAAKRHGLCGQAPRAGMRWWRWRGLRAGGAGGWDERADARLGEWRRSCAVERGLYVCTQLLTLTDPVVPPPAPIPTSPNSPPAPTPTSPNSPLQLQSSEFNLKVLSE